MIALAVMVVCQLLLLVIVFGGAVRMLKRHQQREAELLARYAELRRRNAALQVELDARQ